MLPVLSSPLSHNRPDSRAFAGTTLQLLPCKDLDQRATNFGKNGLPNVFGSFITTPVCIMSSDAGISTTSILIATTGARQKMPNMSEEG